MAEERASAGATFEETAAELATALGEVAAELPDTPLSATGDVIAALLEVSTVYGRFFRERSAALKQSRQLMRLTLESIPAGVAVLDHRGDVLVSNRRWRDGGRLLLVGDPDGSLDDSELPVNVLEVWKMGTGPAAPAAAQAALRLPEVLSGAIDSIETGYDYTQQGRRHWHEVRIHRFTDPGVARAVIIDLDVSERREAEVELQRSRERLHLAMEATNDALWDFDLANDTVFFAPRLAEMLGYALDAFPANYETWQLNTHPEDWPRVETSFADHLLGRTSAYACEYRLRHADGRYLWFSDRGKVVERDGDGVALRCVGVLADINDRKGAEEQIRRLNADLDARVRERTAELEASNKELAAFSYAVSHDLRTPLRTLAGFSFLLQEEVAAKLSDGECGYIERIAASAGRMSAMIDDLLRLSRLSQAKPELELVDMTAIARQAVEVLSESAAGHRPAVRIAEGMSAVGDRGLLSLALTNLIGNAWKFTAHAEAPEISIECDDDGAGECVYSVSDNGAGFDQQYSDKLFGAFQRLHRNDEFEGTGIGLATVARIVRLHGGRVWAEGVLDGGATFSFALPNGSPNI